MKSNNAHSKRAVLQKRKRDAGSVAEPCGEEKEEVTVNRKNAREPCGEGKETGRGVPWWYLLIPPFAGLAARLIEQLIKHFPIFS